MMMIPTGGREGRSRRSVLRLAVAACVIGIVAVLAATGGVDTPSSAAAKRVAPPRPAVTSKAELMVLVDKLVTRGTVESAGALEYSAPASVGGSSRLEVVRKVGDTVNAGDVVALVDGRPVVLMVGTEQLGADVRPSSIGPDVERLQAGLRSIGLTFDPTEAGLVGPTTQVAIRELYARAGFTVETTAEPGGMASGSGESLESKLERLQRAVTDGESALTAAEAAAASRPDPRSAALLAVADAERKVAEAESARDVAVADASTSLAVAQEAQRAGATSTTVAGVGIGGVQVESSPVLTAERALRDAQRQGESAVADANAQVVAAKLQLSEASKVDAGAAAQADQQVEAARSALQAASGALAESRRRDGVVVPRAEVLFVPSLPTTVLAVGAIGGASGGPGGTNASPLFTLRSGDFVVKADVPPGVVIRDGAKGVAESDDGSVVLALTAPATSEDLTMSPPGSAADAGGAVDPAAGLTGAPSAVGASFDIVDATKGDPIAGANLRVSVSTPVTTEKVLAVPLRAILTTDAGSSYVRVKEGATFRRIEVRAGRSGSGMVEVLPPHDGATVRLSAGDEVQVS